MKRILLAFVITATALTVKAQDKKVNFNVGLEAALPMGDMGDAYSMGLGVSALADYLVSEKLSVTGNIGYINFAGKTIKGTSMTIGGYTFTTPDIKVDNASYIPVLVGAKYDLGGLYVSGQLGMTFASASGNSSSAFTFAPGLGYKFTPNIDALVKYTGYSKDGASNSTVGLRVAYTF